MHRQNFAALLLIAVAGSHVSALDPGCNWVPSEPSDGCDTSLRGTLRNQFDPPVANPTTVSRTVNNFSPELVHHNNTCTPAIDTYTVDFEVQQTETYSVNTSTTVEVAQEMKTRAEVYSVAEVETGIKTTVSSTVAFGFSAAATVVNRSSSTIQQTVPPKNKFEILPAVQVTDYIITCDTYATVREYRVDCGGPTWTAFEKCGWVTASAYAQVVSSGANYTTELTQTGSCAGDSDMDNDGIPDWEDPDIDGDGWANDHDDNIDNDDYDNDSDTDIDGDGIPNDQDDSPFGTFQTDDIDGDGEPNHEDDDMDGDGVDNDEDDDIDGDGVLNEDDPDADGDGVADEDDDTNPFFAWIIELIRRLLELFQLV